MASGYWLHVSFWLLIAANMGIKTLCGLPWGSERCSRVGIRVCRTCAQGSAGSWLYLHRWHMARKEKVTNYVQHIQKKQNKTFHCNISVTWTFLLVYRENSSRQHPHFWHWTHGDSKWAQVTRIFPGYGSKWWLEALQTGGIWLASLRSVCLAIWLSILSLLFSLHTFQVKEYLKKEFEKHGYSPNDTHHEVMVDDIFKNEDEDKDGFISAREFTYQHDEL